MKPILTYNDLVNVPVRDNGEPMVIVEDVAPEIVCRYEKQDMIPYLGDRFALRAGVAERLRAAAAALRERCPGYRLRLAYGYRHPEVQEKYFTERKAQVLVKYPSLSDTQLIAQTHMLTASPDVAGHPTGGAVDITIEDADGVLDMGCGIADFASDKIVTFAEGLTETQCANRALLRDVLMAQGFAPFDGEWWHFSYGDREWAAYYGQRYALYEPCAFSIKTSPTRDEPNAG